MNQDDMRQNGRHEGDRRRRGVVARVVPLPDQGNGESLTLMVLVVSATIAIVVSTLATALF